MIMQKTSSAFDDGEAVLITGCSSGIGRQIALTLEEQGFIVFAAVRKEVDADELRSLGRPGLIPLVPLDLTNRAHIANAAATVTAELERRGKPGLFALINNAGGGKPAPIEMMNLDAFENELQARVLGSVAMVQAFLPLLRQGDGRIVWIMTPATIPTPYVASIHACDFAINCIARTLDIELKPWGIPNIMVRCGGIKTPAGMHTTADVDDLLQAASPEHTALYSTALENWGKEMSAFDEKRSDPEKVAEVVLNALSVRKPRMRYAVGHMAQAANMLETLPQPIADTLLKMRS